MENLNTNELMTNVATNLVEDTLKNTWNKVKGYFKDIDAKESIVLGQAYQYYLKNTQIKNSKIKTLIYRHAPKDLYSFYECIGVLYNGKHIDTKSINNLIGDLDKIIITGTGGIGKTTLLKHLFLNAIEETELIPILIELRSFNSYEIKDIVLYDALYNNLSENGFKLEKEYFEYSLEKGGYIILLDGYDEVNRDRTARVSSEIKKLSNKYDKNKYILTSRPMEDFIGWNDFHEMSSLELTKEQALSLIDKIEFNEKVKKIFYKELDERLYDKYRSFASNPLLLTIMLLTFDNHAAIPDKLNDFYDQAFSTLFNMHDATKDAYVRDIRTNLSCEDFKLIFAYICFKSYFKYEYEFSEATLQEYIQKAKDKFKNINFRVEDFQEDLIQSVCMLVKEGLWFRFTHRSFQEYFAAWYTCKLTDDIQYKLLTSWIKESTFVNIDSYFTMLFNLQSEKVNKIILCPGIEQIQKKYNDLGYSVELLKELFTGVTVDTRINEKNEIEEKYVSLRIKDRYLCSITILTCRLNGYAYEEGSGCSSKLANKLYNSIGDDNMSSKEFITFEECLKYVDQELLLSGLEWFKYQLEFIFSIALNNKENAIAKKKKVSTILEEL